MKKEIIYAFIDSQNLNLSVLIDLKDRKTKKIFYKGWKLDFKRFFVYLQQKYQVNKAFLFIGYKEEYKQLYSSLKRWGFQLIFKPTLDHAGKTKGNVDAELVLHSMIELNNYDKAIIVSGDGDFHCLIEYLEVKNKLFRIFVPNEFSYSSLLREFNRKIAFVSRLKSKLEYRKK